MFIVFEGIDGSGKSTHARMLAERFRACNVPVLCTAEPSDGPFGQKIRDLKRRLDPKDEARLFTEDRRDHVRRVILPALRRGETVICDRYVYSSLAYQGARGIDVEWLRSVNREFAPEPDVVFLLEIPVQEALRRIRDGRENHMTLFEVRSDLERVAAIYAALDDPCIRRIQALRDIEAIQAEIVAILEGMGAFP